MLKPPNDIQNYSSTLFTAQSIVLVSELEREKRMNLLENSEKYPNTMSEHPVFAINQKTNKLLMKKRIKLKTVCEKNAEELIKQGRRWERERLLLEEQERQKEITTQKAREKMLEEQTLYIFDPNATKITGMNFLRIKNRKFTNCEINLKDFLLSEKEKKRMIRQKEIFEESLRKPVENLQDNETLSEANETNKDEVESVNQKPSDKIKPDTVDQISSEELKKKLIINIDEDPRITKFKNAECVNEIYELAEELIAGDVVNA
ncbi:CLUMA_CG006910, isoform A [Clunio marinus]|uniref:CLUMA_CG006910, isoform A n=1 Tax=Clunio marinus TaxID=568069 RepID=A0A1J1I3D6_9DIPT|nr:CLUMA_CG006910, isoform A [Clunio marinus]